MVHSELTRRTCMELIRRSGLFTKPLGLAGVERSHLQPPSTIPDVRGNHPWPPDVAIWLWPQKVSGAMWAAALSIRRQLGQKTFFSLWFHNEERFPICRLTNPEQQKKIPLLDLAATAAGKRRVLVYAYTCNCNSGSFKNYVLLL